MNIDVKELEYCKLQINYSADVDTVKRKEKDAINTLKDLNVPGFRKGQAPDHIIKNKFKGRIKQWIEREMLNQANDDILFETKIKLLSKPQVKSVKFDGNNFSCEIIYMKKPDFELKEFKGLKIPKPHMEETIESITESILENIRKQHSPTEERVPLDDELAKKVGKKDVNDLINTVKTIASNQFKFKENQLISEQIKLQLINNHDFKTPTWLTNMEAQYICLQEGKQWEKQEQSIKDNYINKAKDNVKFTLILDSIRAQEPESEISENEAIEIIKNAAVQKGVPNVDEWLNDAMNKGHLFGMISKSKNDYTIQYLINNSKVIE